MNNGRIDVTFDLNNNTINLAVFSKRQTYVVEIFTIHFDVLKNARVYCVDFPESVLADFRRDFVDYRRSPKTISRRFGASERAKFGRLQTASKNLGLI